MGQSIRPRPAVVLLILLQLRQLRNLVLGPRAASRGIRRTGASLGWRSELIVLPLVSAIGYLGAARFIAMSAKATAVALTEGGAENQAVVRSYWSFQLAMLTGACLLGGLGSGRLARKDEDLERLLGLPVRVTDIVAARLILRVAANFPAIPPLLAFCYTVARLNPQLRWPAPAAALLLVMGLILIIASLEVLLQLSLRPRLTPARGGTLQGTLAVVSISAFFVAAAPAFVDDVPFRSIAGSLLSRLPFPWTLAVSSLTGEGGVYCALLFVGEAGAIFATAVLVGAAVLRRTGAQPLAGRPAVRDRRASNSWLARLAILSPLARRDLLLLYRDRRRLILAVIAPVLIAAAAFVAAADRGYVPHLPTTAVIAFSVAAFSQLNTGMTTLAAEGSALPLLYGLPRTAGQIVLAKATTPALIGGVLTTAVFLWGARHIEAATVTLWVTYAALLVGSLAGAVLAASMGVIAFDRRTSSIRVTRQLAWTCVYVLVTGLFAGGLSSGDPRIIANMSILMLVASFAFWQLGSDRFPLLLDRDARPARHLTLSHALLVVLAFSVSNRVFVFVASVRWPGDLGISCSLVLSLLVALAGSWAVAAICQVRRPQLLSMRPTWASGALGLMSGLVLGVLVSLTENIVRGTGVGVLSPSGTSAGPRAVTDWIALLVLIFFAPPLEEFVFRGLVFASMRRSASLPVCAGLSALLFASYHPSGAVPAVFLLGLVCAAVAEKTRTLFASTVTHVTFNLIVTALSLHWLF